MKERLVIFCPSLGMLIPRLARTLMALGLLTLAVLSTSTTSAIERVPIEDFAREPEVSRAKLSPDGRHLAFLRQAEGRTMILVSAIDESRGWRIDPGTASMVNDAPKEVEGFAWVSDQRLLLATSVWDAHYGVLAADLNGRNATAISGYETISPGSIREPATYIRDVLARCFESDPIVLMVDRHERTPGNPLYPDVARVDTASGSVAIVVKNPGEVVSWLTDDKGVVRAGFTSHGKLSGMIYRDKEGEPWRTLFPPEKRSSRLRSMGYDAAKGKFLVVSLNQDRRWVPCHVDPDTTELGEPLLSDPDYDIIPERSDLRVDGIPLCAPVFAPNGKGLIGFRYFTEAPRVKWFDREFAEYQRKMDRGLPNTVNIPVEISRDGKRMLWFSFSDQDPGTYFLSDLEKRSLKPLAKRMSWIKPTQMAPMLSVQYTARDGVVIHGYLTVPVGHPPKNLPLIVLPHGGPWVRDIWEFDPLVQLLANRGYAVLQMNYRGSPGYGEELYEKARREIGGDIQNDIEDATRWAIAAGVADPKRIAIVGASYGGYSALFGLGKNPELYRCGISMAGVTDWLDIFERRRRDPDYKRANEYWREQIGDPEKDADRLRAASPVNFAEKITAPVLIVQGKQDRIVPPQQAHSMIAALEKHGQKPERLFLPKVGHSFGEEKSRIVLFKRVIAFLEENLGPGVE